MADAGIIYVYKDWDTVIPEKIGIIYVEGGKGKEIISFEYDDSWLKRQTQVLFSTQI